MRSDHNERESVTDLLTEYGRGLAGGLLVSLPLLYTMEVWWTAFTASPERLLLYIAFTFLLLLAYNAFGGIRADRNWTEVVIDAVQEFGMGIVISTAILFLTSRIGVGESLAEAVAKIAVEAGIVAIGFSVGVAQLGGGERGGGGSEQQEPNWPPIIRQSVIALCAAVVFASNVAPTMEIVKIATESSPLRLSILLCISIALGVLILYYSGFTGSKEIASNHSIREIVTGSAMTYAVALLASAASLWFFGRLDGMPLAIVAREIIVLAFPATLGSSAGRLLIQGAS